MDVTLPADSTMEVEREIANGNYRSRDELIEQAVRQFFGERRRPRQLFSLRYAPAPCGTAAAL